MNLKSKEFIYILLRATLEIGGKKIRNIWKEMIRELTTTIDEIGEPFTPPSRISWE